VIVDGAGESLAPLAKLQRESFGEKKKQSKKQIPQPAKGAGIRDDNLSLNRG
jgi:hypothetical protein